MHVHQFLKDGLKSRQVLASSDSMTDRKSARRSLHLCDLKRSRSGVSRAYSTSSWYTFMSTTPVSTLRQPTSIVPAISLTVNRMRLL